MDLLGLLLTVLTVSIGLLVLAIIKMNNRQVELDGRIAQIEMEVFGEGEEAE